MYRSYNLGSLVDDVETRNAGCQPGCGVAVVHGSLRPAPSGRRVKPRVTAPSSIQQQQLSNLHIHRTVIIHKYLYTRKLVNIIIEFW